MLKQNEWCTVVLWQVNVLYVPVGALQRPFLSRPAPPLASLEPPSAVDWGGLGTLCAAAMMRALDAVVRSSSSATRRRYRSASACLATLYDSFSDGSERVERSDQLSERWAEVAGLRLAYAAWTRQTGAAAGQKLELVFFSAFTTLWCQHTTPQMAALDARAKPHASPRTRVDAALSQLPAFATSHGCKGGVQCELW